MEEAIGIKHQITVHICNIGTQFLCNTVYDKNFCWLKIPPMAHTSYCDKNFANCARKYCVEHNTLKKFADKIFANDMHGQNW